MNSLRTKHFTIWVFNSAQLILQNHGSYHRGSHSPLLKAGRHIEMRSENRIFADKRDSVMRHTVLSRPMAHFLTVRIIQLCHFPKVIMFSSVSIFSGSMGAPAKQQEIPCLPKGKPILIYSNVHSFNFCAPGKRQHIASLLMLTQKIEPRYITKRIVGCNHDFIRSQHHVVCDDPIFPDFHYLDPFPYF